MANILRIPSGGGMKITTESFATPKKSTGSKNTYTGSWQSSHKWKCVGIQRIGPNGAGSGWWNCNIASASISASGLLSVEIHNSSDRTESLQAKGTIVGVVDE